MRQIVADWRSKSWMCVGACNLRESDVGNLSRDKFMDFFCIEI